MENFKKKFIEEASDNINELENALLEIENSPNDSALVERIFRALHSLKGGGAMFGFVSISTLTHDLENIYELIRQGKRGISDEITSATLETVDHLRNLLQDPDLTNDDLKVFHNQMLQKIQHLVSTDAPVLPEAGKEAGVNEQPSKALRTFYILFQPNANILANGTNPMYLLDELLTLGDAHVIAHTKKIPSLQEISPDLCYLYWEVYLATDTDVNTINEVFIFVEDDCHLDIQLVSNDNLLQNNQAVSILKKLHDSDQEYTFSLFKQELNTKHTQKDAKLKPNFLAKEQTITSIRVSSEKLDQLMNLVSELVTTQARLTLFSEAREDQELDMISENIQKLTRQLRDIAFSIVLIPIDTIIMRFQRLVRDLSKNLNKTIDFTSEGTETELDKTIIENLVDPIMHIIRNSIDHGIESIEERKKKGKPEIGSIHLKAYYSGASVHIDISDDGAGINKDKVLKKAIEKGIIAPDAQLTDKEIFNLLFLPAFSTADKVTDVSGRGVGMDVVSKKINEIRGEVSISSVQGKSTTIHIVIPLTLSIIDGLLVRVVDQHFILPLSVVNKIYAIKHTDTLKSRNHLLILDGEQVPYINLRKEFSIAGDPPDNEEVVVAQYDKTKVGIITDSVVGEYQAVLKALGKQFSNIDYLSGASILGDGRIALVLDSNKMIKRITKKKDLKENVLTDE